MATSPKDITFVVPGAPLAPLAPQLPMAAAVTPHGQRRSGVRVGARRGDGESVRLTATPGADVVVLSLLNGPTLVLHPASARDLMRAQASAARRGANDSEDSDELGVVQVPAQLGWPGLEHAAAAGAARGGTSRGWLGQAVLQAIEVVTGQGTTSRSVDLVAEAATKALDGRVDAGLYQLAPDALVALKGSGRKLDVVPPSTAPMLVLVHGTFVDTVSTFGKFWAQQRDAVSALFERYGERVYALDHPTLGQSPITNALTLVRALPPDATLHLLTHSRGGLVAETLARACGAALTAADLALFAGPAYARHRTELQALSKEARAKRIRVQRLVRVGCPARGTLLASRRLDAYLSVLKWGLELAGLPVAAELVDFLTAVAQRRADPAELPGLEAMLAEGAMVKWLNSSTGEPLTGRLCVVAGDLEGDSLGAWVKTLLADAFFWTDNDLVVQTRSMYGGSPRASGETREAGDATGGDTGGTAGASFVLDRGAKVTHFTYFSNDSSVRAILSGLLDARPADYRPIGPLSWAGQDAGGTRAARAVARSRGADADGRPATQRPAVFVIPGILGSNLARDGQRVWLGLHFVNGLKTLAWDPATVAHITPDGPIGTVYDGLIEHLSHSHEVIPFAFDWRRPIEDEGRRLADAVEAALAARDGSGQPVRLIVHSMGGLVARAMQLERPQVWQRLMARDGARLLMLGTPNGGSWAPMQVLSGDDTFGNALTAFGALFDDAGARKLMAAMPGFIQLQAGLLDPALGLARAEKWQALADEDLKRVRELSLWHTEGPQVAAYEWGAPPQDVLDQAVALRRRFDAQLSALAADAPKMLLVVGHARFTPAGIQMTDQGLDYLDAPDTGDGRVTLDSALLPGVRTWACDAAHGDLPSTASAFAAYAELLDSGETTRLPRQAGVGGDTRSASSAPVDPATPAALVPSRPSRGRRPSEPPSFAGDLFVQPSSPDAASTAARGQALPITVVNGNLKFVAQPLMLGHYRSNQLTGAERMVDTLIGGAMSESLKAGLYPSGIDSAQVFINRRRHADEPLAMPRPASVIVIGLGEEGRLRLGGLAHSVCQGVMACAQRASEQGAGGPTSFELAATLIGSGGVGMNAASAAQAIALGVAQANRRLMRCGWPTVSHLRLIELYLDRASEAHHGLSVLVASAPRDLVLTPAIERGVGALRRPLDWGYRGADYDFITAVQYFDDHHQPLIEYTLDTQRARSEVRGQATQARLVDELVRAGADSDNIDTRIGRSLFQLLVPVEIRPFLSGSTAIVLQLDESTARFPWEMLDVSGRGSDDTGAFGAATGDGVPWAVRTQVVRKLRTATFRDHPADAGREGGMLVIGEPKADPKLFAALPAAREEAKAVALALAGCTLLMNPDALQAVNALLAQPLRVVHIAGHGDFREDGSGGVVLSNGTMLGAREIQAMDCVPDLVFVNCCFVGQIHPDPAVPRNALGPRRAEFAASIAEELIRIGVRCVVAAGWAVEDEPAQAFAVRFYAQLLEGASFIEAVGSARRAAWEAHKEGNTWAAYQCYGDPDWKLVDKEAVRDARRALPIISAPALALALETAALEARYRDEPAQQRVQRLVSIRQLDARYAGAWGSTGAVAEAFGLAYAECGDDDAAVQWYERALAAADGSASFKAAEQLGNLMARRGGRRSDPKAARSEIRAAISRLNHLVLMHGTVERHSLLGSAWKRLAMVEHAQADLAQELAALRETAKHYGQAETLALAIAEPAHFYPAMNAIAATVRMALLQGEKPALEPTRMASALQSLQAAVQREPDFWSVVGVAEWRMLEALAAGRMAAAQQGIEQSLADLKARADAPAMWGSVADQAQFTLGAYAEAASASAAEKVAAQALLARLAVYAKVGGG